MASTTAETQRLRRCIRDLVALSALPTVWVGFDVYQIGEHLADELARILQLDWIVVRVGGQQDSVRTADGRPAPQTAQQIGELLAPWLKPDGPSQDASLPNPAGRGALRVVAMPLGYFGQRGVLVACSHRKDFPTETEHLLLNVAANQAAGLLQQKHAEQVLTASEREFRTLADSIPHLAWMARADGYRLWYNRRWYDYTGTTLELAMGWGWQSLHDATELSRILAKFNEAVEKGEPWEDTYPLRRHDGVMRQHLSRAVPVRDERGRVVRWFGTHTDVTDLIKMEETLREADRQKNVFLSMLAHELRNPLVPISNAVQLMRLCGPATPEMEDIRSMIGRQVQHLVRLVDDLLDVSRITCGKIRLQSETVELAAILTRALETSRSQIEIRGHVLKVALPEGPIHVQGDSVRLAQVFSNLLNNAAKYTPEGGRIELSLEREGDEAVVRVRDTGMGIPPEMLTAIFNLFTQLERSLDRSHGGLGIGLTVVQRLVEMHGGRVQAFSAGPDRGSEFVVRLPELKRELPRPAAAAPVPHAHFARGESRGGEGGVRRRVLLVDDHKDAARSLAHVLRLSGHEVHVCHDGPSALAAAQTFLPDVVLLDIGLPGMDGYEVARRLRAMPGAGKVLLVAITGYGQPDDFRRSREAGFDHHFIKPVSSEALIARLASPRGKPVSC